jgi:Xaa-Pro aminopeptidase
VKRPRLSAIRALGRKHSCSHILVSDPVDCEYLSGFRSSNIKLLVSSRKALLFTDFRYQEAAEAFCRAHPPWKLVVVGEGDKGALAKELGSGAVMGIQSDIMTVAEYDRLRRSCRGTRLVKIAGEVSELFAVKQPRELRALGRAAAIGDKAFGALLGELRAGVSERWAARRLEDLCRELGAEGPSFDTIVLFGSRAALPHGTPTDRRLRKGDWVLCDFGCVVEGLCSDMTRTVVYGKATRSQREVYEVVRRAQAAARKALRPGVKASSIDRAARSLIDEVGYGDAFGHATGHGLGRRVHEGPRLSKRDHRVLRSGMVVTVEPGIYQSGRGGVRIEDMMVLSERGARSLTSSPRTLTELEP